MNQSSAPIFEELLRFIGNLKGNYFVPGHKQGTAFDIEALPWFSTLLKLDLTEVGNLDDLHQASGVIDEAQRLAARAFFADKTFFLVGGTTAGNLATILTLCHPADEIIVQRSCHQSIFNGCMLAGAKPVTLPVHIDPETGFEEPIRPQQVERLLRKYPRAKGVVVTSPSYYGGVEPIHELSAICHKNNIPLIVDEAHGAHFGFHPLLPPSAMQCGADVAVQSTHKLLTSMTMSSMLHVQGSRVNVHNLARHLRMIQSSSPSYPLLASLDLARRHVVKYGASYIDKAIILLNELRSKIQRLDYLQEVCSSAIQDPFKLVLQAHNVSGYTLQKWLEDKGHYIELADDQKVLCVFSMGTTQKQYEKLFDSLCILDKGIPQLRQQKVKTMVPLLEYTQVDISWNQIKMEKRNDVPLEQAVGSIVAEMVIPYPPGIPFLLPGELFTLEKKKVLLHLIQSGCNIRGIANISSSPSICMLQ